MFFFSFLVSLLLLLWGGAALEGNVIITTPQGLIDFSTKVNKGTSYSGLTVYLDSDLDFTSVPSLSFVPIGKTTNYTFNGTFDGQGHVIRNLTINMPSQYTGLFGYLKAANIKDVVIDSSCSIKKSRNSRSDTGSIVGYCESCTIENAVNMASVSFTGKPGRNSVSTGGIIGRLLYSSAIKNCVNYGPVTQSGDATGSGVSIGGIVGTVAGSNTKSIENCANYGTLIYNGTIPSTLFIGGIVGNSWAGTVTIENCVSAGNIFKVTPSSIDNYFGIIVGYAGTNTTITHCLWTNDIGYDTVYGYDEKTEALINVTNSSLTELSTTTLNELIRYANTNSCSKWFILHLNGGAINSGINQDILIVTQKHFPDPVKEGNTFLFWCTDVECTDKYYPNTTDITNVTDLYAMWNKYKVTFDFGNRTNSLKDVAYGEKYGVFPKIEAKEGYTFVGWFTEKEDGKGERITEDTFVSLLNEHTLHAHWEINNYTLTFIFNNGENDEVRIANYNRIIDYPNIPLKEGYTFNGWDINITTMPAHNINITALWIKITNFVEIVFIKKDLKEEEIREIINEYTDKDFTIVKVEFDEETGGTKVIVKFNNVETAEKFVRDIDENKKGEGTIKRVGIVYYGYTSFSFTLYPLILCLFIF